MDFITFGPLQTPRAPPHLSRERSSRRSQNSFLRRATLMLRVFVAAGLIAGLATQVFANAPDSLTIPARQRPTASAPT